MPVDSRSPPLHVAKPRLALNRGPAQVVQLLVVAFPDDAAFFDGQRRVRRYRALKQLRDVLQRVQQLVYRAQEFAVKPAQRPLELRHAGKRGLECQAIAGADGVVSDLGQQPLDVVSAAEGFPQLVSQKGVLLQLSHRVQPLVDLIFLHQRPLDPALQRAAAHGGLRLVQEPQKRSGAPGP